MWKHQDTKIRQFGATRMFTQHGLSKTVLDSFWSSVPQVSYSAGYATITKGLTTKQSGQCGFNNNAAVRLSSNTVALLSTEQGGVRLKECRVHFPP